MYIMLYKLMFNELCFHFFPEEKILKALKPLRIYLVYIKLLLSFPTTGLVFNFFGFLKEIIIYPSASCLQNFVAVSSHPMIFILISFCFF